MNVAVLNLQRRKRFERDVPPPFQITARDIELVRHVAQHRFLRSTHLSALVGSSHKKVCDRLTALFHAGYLDRPRAQLEYHVRDGGSAPMVYALDVRGARLLRESEIATHRNDGAFKKRDVHRPYILHTLGIADLRVALALSLRTRADLTLFMGNGLSSTTRLGTLPTKATRLAADLVPDAMFSLRCADGRQRSYCVEVDQETMPVVRHGTDQSSIVRKLLAYADARTRKCHTTQFGWRTFRVLFITETVRRFETILTAVHQHVPTHSDLFLAIDRQTLIVASDVLKLPWHNARGQTATLAP